MRTDTTAPDFVRMPLSSLVEKPLISVIMASYNHAAFVGDAIESVLAQTYQHFELIVCDDGSPDNSREVIERYAQRDSRIRPLYKRNGGQASAWNLAYEHARGEIICLLDSDDVFVQNKLEKVVKTLRQHPAAGLCLHQLAPVTESAAPLGPPFPEFLASGWVAAEAAQQGGWRSSPPTSGICIRREVADRIFPVPFHYRGGGDTYITGAGRFLTELAALPEVLTKYRIHGANVDASRYPTTQSISRMLDSYALHVTSLQRFLTDTFGSTSADQLQIDDLRSYWEYLLALFILEGKPRSGVRGYTVDVILSHIPDTPRKRLWRTLLLLPPGAGRRAFQLWWGIAPWKRFTRPLARRLGVK